MSVVRLFGRARNLEWPAVMDGHIQRLRAMEERKPSRSSGAHSEYAVWKRSYAPQRATAARCWAGGNGLKWSVQPFELTALVAGPWPRIEGSAWLDYLYNQQRPVAVILHTQRALPPLPAGVVVDQLPASWHRGTFTAYALRPEGTHDAAR